MSSLLRMLASGGGLDSGLMPVYQHSVISPRLTGPCSTHGSVYHRRKPPKCPLWNPGLPALAQGWCLTRCREVLCLSTLPGSLSAQFQAAVM